MDTLTRKPPKRVLWQGKYLDGFLLVILDSSTHISGTLYTQALEFKLEAEIVQNGSPKAVVDAYLECFEREYLQSEMERANAGSNSLQ